MRELLKRFKARPFITAELILASFVISVLALSAPIFVIQVLNRYVSHGLTPTLITLVMGVLIAIGMEFLIRQVRMKLISGLNSKREAELQTTSFDSLTGAKPQAVERTPQGLLRETMDGLNNIHQAYMPANIATVLDAVFAVLYVIALFLLLPILGVIAIGFIATMFLVIGITQTIRTKPQHELNKLQSGLSGLLNSAIQSADSVRAFGASGFLRTKWQQSQTQANDFRQNLSTNSSFNQSFTQMLAGLLSVTVISVGALYVVSGELNIGTMIGANILASRALSPFSRLAQLGGSFARARESLAMLEKFQKIPQEETTGSKLDKLVGKLEIKNLGYSYPQNKNPVFEGLSFTLPAGSLLVVRGLNGSGKTTFARLMTGILEPRQGQILADGVDLKQLDINWWRQLICYVPQEPDLFNATIYQNLIMGLEDVPVSKVNKAVRDANLDVWLKTSTDGLKTQIKNGGTDLPLGIRRRIALARALLRNGKIAIWDEPVEGVDPEGRKAIMDALAMLSKQGCTVIVCSSNPQFLKGKGHTLDMNHKPTPVYSKAKPKTVTALVGNA